MVLFWGEKAEEKQNSVAIMISVDGKEIFFSYEPEISGGIVWIKILKKKYYLPQPKVLRKYRRRFSLLRNSLNVKHHSPSKSMSSKYHIIKIFENCFQNLNSFSWIKLIAVLIHPKYWYYNSPYLEFPCLHYYLCQMLP